MCGIHGGVGKPTLAAQQRLLLAVLHCTRRGADKCIAYIIIVVILWQRWVPLAVCDSTLDPRSCVASHIRTDRTRRQVGRYLGT